MFTICNILQYICEEIREHVNLLLNTSSVGGNVNPLDFLVRSKNYIFWETLEHYKKTEHSVQFLPEHFVDFQDQNIMTSHFTLNQISFFPKCDI